MAGPLIQCATTSDGASIAYYDVGAGLPFVWASAYPSHFAGMWDLGANPAERRGFIDMGLRLGDDAGRAGLREHERITRETLKEFGGAEVKTMGDGFMASFGSVTKAVECAIALQRAFAAHNADVGARGHAPLHVRVGLNAGEPIEEDGDLFGSTVILASRIAAQASPGEVLVPDTVRGLCSGKGFMFSDRGEVVPKGFDDAVRLYEVRWREDAP